MNGLPDGCKPMDFEDEDDLTEYDIPPILEGTK
jgi:hypothetical protein